MFTLIVMTPLQFELSQFQQLASKANMPTGIKTCNNRDYNLIEVLKSQRQCAS